MGVTAFFYDSYAIIEYLKDNPDFIPYFESSTGMLTMFNLAEVYYSVLQESGQKKADQVFETLYPLCIVPDNETIRKAMQFRLENKKRGLSYADCIGYQTAKAKKVRFLTGDRQFKDMDNVEFVARTK